MLSLWGIDEYLPWEILVSIILTKSLVITHLVPFVALGGSNDHKTIGVLTFKDKCTETSNEFKGK